MINFHKLSILFIVSSRRLYIIYSVFSLSFLSSYNINFKLEFLKKLHHLNYLHNQKYVVIFISLSIFKFKLLLFLHLIFLVKIEFLPQIFKLKFLFYILYNFKSKPFYFFILNSLLC